MKDIETIILNKNKEIKDEYKGCLSVSKLFSNFLKKPFEEEKMAQFCYEKGLTDPNYKYANMSVNEILNLWHTKAETSKHYGRLLDNFADLYFNNLNEELEKFKIDNNFDIDERLKNNCLGVIQFYDFITKMTNYKFVAREVPVYYTTPSGNKINGRLDLLLYDENTDAYIIIDWKTTENITISSKYDKLLGPCSMLDDCDMNIYTLQLHIYKQALVNTYHIASADRISVAVINLLRKSIDEEYKKYYKIFNQNFNYNYDFINKCIDFGYSI